MMKGNRLDYDERDIYLARYNPNPLHGLDLFRESYPISDYPDCLNSVLMELADNSQAPLELIGGVVLSAISLACQAFINVQYPDGRIKPCSLYNMILAGSGERKSAVYSLVMQPFLEYEKRERAEYEEELKKYNAKMLIWKLKEKLFINNIKKKVVADKCYDLEEYELEDHILEKPTKPGRMKLIYNDTTPEALQWGLHENIPFAGLMSDEANVFFAGRAKNDPEFLNKLWDGLPYDIERRTSTSITVEAKFTMLLMIQNDLFFRYYKKHGERAGSSGFLSRFLLTTVNSTQGNRQVIPGKSAKNELDKFHERINFFLSSLKGKSINNKEVMLLSLSSSATRHYYNFQNETERLNSLHRDNTIISFLSKAPENAIRLASLLNYFQDDKSGEISEVNVVSAINIITHYINQSIFLLTQTLSTLEQDAEFVYDWLCNRQKIIRLIPGSYINKIVVQRNISRTHLRKKVRLDAAIKMLVQQGKICVELQSNTNGSVSELLGLPKEP